MSGGVKVAPESRVSIEKKALQIRQQLFPNRSVMGGITGQEFLEALDCCHSSISYGVKESSQISGVEAISVFEPMSSQFCIYLREDVYEDLLDGQPRALFTCAHEIGHWVLHSTELRAARTLPHGLARGAGHPVYCDSEWQANVFAGAFLAPTPALNALRPNLNAEILQTRFGLSRSAAEARLRSLRK